MAMSLRRSAQTVGLCLVAGSIGYFARGYEETSAPSVERATGPIRGPVASGSVVTARLSAEDKAELLALIREEQRSVVPGQSGATLAPERPANGVGDEQVDAEDAFDLTDEQIAQYDRASRMVRTAVAGGAWSARDRDQLRETMGHLPHEVWEEITKPLIVAINRDQVRFEGHGPPL